MTTQTELKNSENMLQFMDDLIPKGKMTVLCLCMRYVNLQLHFVHLLQT